MRKGLEYGSVWEEFQNVILDKKENHKKGILFCFLTLFWYFKDIFQVVENRLFYYFTSLTIVLVIFFCDTVYY